MLWAWRHPKAIGASGRCIGAGTDLPVDRRKAKRLAHRIRATARRQGLPRVVWTSTLRRASAVGQVLRAWGWRHLVDARLSELHFGAWEGQAWRAIAQAEVDAWVADFAQHAAGGGESLAALQARVQAFVAEHVGAGALLVVTHGGWLNALRLLPALVGGTAAPGAAQWPAPPAHNALVRWPMTLPQNS
jgi:alpha-ribazole phosphatase